MKTRARGYGGHHKRTRNRWTQLVATGTIRCARGPTCRYAEHVNGALVGGLIAPDDAWDLGHDDRDRSRYTGPEHAACNRATTSHKPPRKRPSNAHPGVISAETE